MNWWKQYQVDVPPGTLGDCVVEQFEVSPKDAAFSSLRAAISRSSAGRAVPVGKYTSLRLNGAMLMSDTPAEILDLLDVFHDAKGPCLVNGLGLGVVVKGLLDKKEVSSVTVIEINQNVADYVGGHWKQKYGNRLTIIAADALDYRPPRGLRYGYVWHDIWPAICRDNLEDMKRLHRRYGRRCEKQGSWCRSLCERY